MSNLDKLTLNGTTYTIVDSTVGGQIATASAGLANAIEYDSLTERINLKHDNTVLGFVDASAFIVDGFLDNVEVRDVATITEYTIKDGETGESPITPEAYDELSAADKEKYEAHTENIPCLVFTWNVASGKQSINIPLTDIFNPSNYYSKSQVDTLLAGKQATLVSGTNIKTINGNSILGEGNLVIESGSQITVDSELSTSSTNPVENRVITTALGNKANSADLASVATSGAYSDLSGTPFIPTITYDSTNTALVINTVAPAQS